MRNKLKFQQVLTVFSSVLVLILRTVDAGAAGADVWATSVYATGSSYGMAVAKDSADNVYVAGSFYGTANFMGTTLTSNGGSDLFLAKLNSAGALQWAKAYGGGGQEGNIRTIAVDNSGNIYLAGQFSGTINVGGSDLKATPSTDVNKPATFDGFVAKYSSQGNPLWAKTFGGSADDYVGSMAVDTTGQKIFVSGQFNEYVCTTFCQYSDGESFVSQFNSADGSFAWRQTFLHQGTNFASKVLVDKQNNIFLAGYFVNFYINLGLGNLNVFRDANVNWTDAFLAKFAPATATGLGPPLWTKRIGGNAKERITDAALDGSGDVVLYGTAEPAYVGTDLGGGPLVGTGAYSNLILAKYAGSDGAFQWGRIILAPTISPSAIAVDSANNSYITGYFSSDGYFYDNSASDRQLLKLVGYNDIFLAKYSPLGRSLWARSYGASRGSAQPTALVIDSTDHPILTGGFDKTLNFDGTSLTSGSTANPFVFKTANSIFSPADSDLNWQISVNEAVNFGTCWRNPSTPGCPPNPTIENVTSAASIWKLGEKYHYDGSKLCPACWIAP